MVAMSGDEKRQLRETIVALRERLEELQAGEEERIERAVARANNENRQLKETINALRDELENARGIKE